LAEGVPEGNAVPFYSQRQTCAHSPQATFLSQSGDPDRTFAAWLAAPNSGHLGMSLAGSAASSSIAPAQQAQIECVIL
jgi:hypothetical protein